MYHDPVPMPLPSFIISASIIVCEKVLIEKDEVASAIRVVDIFYVPELPPEPTESPESDTPTRVPLVTAWALANIRANPGYAGANVVELKFQNTSGTITPIGDPGPQQFTSKINGTPSAVGIVAQLHLGVKRLGVCYVLLYVDGEEIAKVPITLARATNDARTQ